MSTLIVERYEKKLSIIVLFSFILLGLVIFIQPGFAADVSATQSTTLSGVNTRAVDIWSDGTRLSGDLFFPESMEKSDRLPAIILCHGWGGLRSHLNAMFAPVFARAGFIVLTFDYRGWGDSDSRLIMREKMPAPDDQGYVKVSVQAVRELIDPFDQTEDIVSCIDFISGEDGVDPDRIGLWGVSFGGGHAVYVAAHDERVKCIVAQIPSMDGSWAAFYPDTNAFIRAIQRARGEIDPVPQGESSMGGALRGTPYLSKIAKYRPVAFADQLKVPTLINVASKDELINNSAHGQLVYNRVKNRIPSRYDTFDGTHFEFYTKVREKAVQNSIDWFNEYLRKE